MFEKVLIANRGEIGLRTHRACHEMGIKTVGVHSTADAAAMHVRLADETVCIGPPAGRASYLNMPAILSAATISGADAIHPGLGFLAENADFAALVEEHGFTFIGPAPDHIRLMGDKIAAKAEAMRLGIPVVPGSPAAVRSIADAEDAARTIGYPGLLKAAAGGAGPMEFLYQDGAFYFIEMNTRLQVEHPVSEMISGVDIVCEQLRIAAGAPLGYRQSDITLRGHAIECRINAESPVDFRPSPGRIGEYHAPGGPGVRVDSALYQGYEVPPFYDSLIGKLIVHGASREECVMRLRRALAEYVIGGIETTIPLHQRLVDEPDFRNRAADIHSLERFLAQGS